MRSHKTVTALAIMALLATLTTVGPLGSTMASARPSRPCTPTWQSVPVPQLPAGRGFYDPTGGVEAISPDNVVFAGATSFHFVPSKPHLLRWNGAAIGESTGYPWVDPMYLQVTDASFDSADSGWLVGIHHRPSSRALESFATRWDGQRWTTVPLAPSPDPTRAVTNVAAVASVAPDDAWMVGSLNSPEGHPGTVIQRWDGTRWHVVAQPLQDTPNVGMTDVNVLPDGDVWAVGARDAAGRLQPLALRWDGSRWSQADLPVIPDGGYLLDVGGTGASDVWAVGVRGDVEFGPNARPLVMHWDGSQWTVVTELPDVGGPVKGVYAASPTDVWAAITIRRPSGNDNVGFLHWDGRTWTATQWPGTGDFGRHYVAADIDGTGPNDVWALATSLTKDDQTQPDVPVVVHLTCAGR